MAIAATTHDSRSYSRHIAAMQIMQSGAVTVANDDRVGRDLDADFATIGRKYDRMIENLSDRSMKIDYMPMLRLCTLSDQSQQQHPEQYQCQSFHTRASCVVSMTSLHT